MTETGNQAEGSPAAEPSIKCSHTPDEQTIAVLKADFCARVWELSKGPKRISAKDACAVLSVDPQFASLATLGKNGRSLVGATSGHHNYRSWSRKLGILPGNGRPISANWRRLLPQYRGSRVYERPGNPDFWVVLARVYEHPNRLSLKDAYGTAVRHFNLLDAPNVADLAASFPTYSQVHHWYRFHADKKAVLLARYGEEWFRNNLGSYIIREAPEVGECWVGDHHIFDCAVRIICERTGKWIPARPWLTSWLDWGSLGVMGCWIDTTYPSRDSIERALRLGVEANAYRSPRFLLVDNGRDFRARGFSAPPLKMNEADEQRLHCVTRMLHSEVRFAISHNARAKIIERFHKEVCKFSKLWPSYRGSSPKDRPKGADWYWNHPESLPTLGEFRAKYLSWLANIYMREPSFGETLKGKSPAEALAAAKQSRVQLDPGLVYKAFLREVPGGARKVLRGGVVCALRRYYRSEELWKRLDGSARVIVKLDPDDLSKAWIYTEAGVEIGPAERIKPLPAMIDADTQPETAAQLREQIKRQRRERAEVRKISAYNRGIEGRNTDPADLSALVPCLASAHAAPDQPARPAHQTPPQELAPADRRLVDALDEAMREEAASRAAASDDVDPWPEGGT